MSKTNTNDNESGAAKALDTAAGSINRRRELFMLLEDLGPIGTEGNMATDYFRWMSKKIKEALEVRDAGVRIHGLGVLREPVIYDHDKFDQWLESLVEWGDNQFL